MGPVSRPSTQPVRTRDRQFEVSTVRVSVLHVLLLITLIICVDIRTCTEYSVCIINLLCIVSVLYGVLVIQYLYKYLYNGIVIPLTFQIHSYFQPFCQQHQMIKITFRKSIGNHLSLRLAERHFII